MNHPQPGASRAIDILDTFPGASVGTWQWNGECLTVGVRPEPVVRADWIRHDYAIHFVFGTASQSTQPISFRIRVGSPKAEICKACPGRIFSSHRPDAEFALSDPSAATDHRGYSEWKVELGPGETRYWANTLWRPLAALDELFPPLAAGARLEAHQFGTSVEGRALTAYLGPRGKDDARPAILITSGLHPMEGDTVGTEAVLQWLAGDGSSVLDRWNVVVVPVANPDGFAHGYNGCNSSGINFFWDFRRQDPTCPEASSLWELMARVLPLVHIDYHAYSVQGPRKQPGPYVMPMVYRVGKQAKQLARALQRELSEIPATTSQMVLAPSSMPFRVTKAFNTVTFAKYHLHQDLGREGMRAMAVDVVKRVVDGLEHNPVRPDLVHIAPYGRVRPRLMDRVRQTAYTTRYLVPRIVRPA